jgi:small subunit ribosomal protein S1
MEKYLSEVKDFTEGMLVQGKVLEVRSNDVLVDIGYKSEGIIPRTEFDDPENVKPGDQVEVLLEKIEDDDGMVVLSYEKAALKKNWDSIVKLCNEGGTIEGRVKAKVKGGFTVNIGVDAFLPASQLDVIPPRDLDQFVGKTYQFKVVKINEDRKNIVLSRRELIEQERDERRKQVLGHMQAGQIRTGTVKNITDFGAFIDLDGIDGLLHVTDMSWGRISHPSELVRVGDQIEVMVLEVDRDKERVSLGLKQKNRNPWDDIALKYPVGAKVHGKIVSVVPYGAFVQLEDGVEGMVHVSEMSWTKRIARASDVLKAGDEIDAVVLDIKRDEQKIALGIRQLESNPWTHIPKKYPPGTRISGKVRNLTNFGAFVEVEEGIDGMVHVSDLSWTRKITNPAEVLKKGQKVDAVVLEVDSGNQRMSLGIKQLEGDPWKNIEQRYRIGDLIKGKVVKLTSFGAFIELPDKLEGLVHISQISEERIEKIKDVLKVGTDVTARVIKVDSHDRRIGLSIKAAAYSTEQLEAEKRMFEDALRPGEAIVDLEHAFERAEDDKSEKNQ